MTALKVSKHNVGGDLSVTFEVKDKYTKLRILNMIDKLARAMKEIEETKAP